MSESVTVVLGEMLFAPIQYNNFKIGGHQYTTEIRPGETPEQAFDRAYAFLLKKTREEYGSKKALFHELHASLVRR
jgi:hypothetical protein